ncbi:metallophosphoesterase [Halobaculum sp. CBA1158]|uniref:metallophosphoesterase n=1 Tax=Halobaculum sp. CBA1158 TaxID=2904243 RepID=UPI001F38A3EE|nr:metallophosphoesterase [Halobaculum sp. CBA1158]UIP00140.1 metallophosphoesterase [Halobaculum sp. CBA1158]
MLAVISDTHATDDHRLRGRTLDAVRSADAVIHAGDFYREPVLEALLDVNDSLYGVTGNNDDAALRDRLPGERVVAHEGATIAVRHRSRSGATGLALFGRERDADLVVFGHSHRPEFDDSGPVPLLNPGSYAQPRGNRAAHAELARTADGLSGRLVTPEGEPIEEFAVPVRDA